MCMKISIRIDDDLNELIKNYSNFIKVDFSKAARILLKEGLINKAPAKFFSMWKQKASERNILFPEKCDKCGTSENLQVYHINGDIDDFNFENLAILCNGDIRKLQKSMMQYNPKEKFIQWFYLEN